MDGQRPTSDDLRPRPPGRGHFDRVGETALRVEDAACRRALRAVGASAAQVARHCGAAGNFPRMTFAMLASALDFPSRPAVSGLPPDEPSRLLTAFPRTALWGEWVSTWDLRPEVRRGERAMVMRGGGWGTVVVRYAEAQVDGPRLLIGPDRGKPLLAVCDYRDWLVELGWIQDQRDAGDESDFS